MWLILALGYGLMAVGLDLSPWRWFAFTIGFVIVIRTNIVMDGDR
jgi:hypothetical protein